MLLGSGLSVFAQPKASFDKTMHEFGTILWKNPVTATFKDDKLYVDGEMNTQVYVFNEKDKTLMFTGPVKLVYKKYTDEDYKKFKPVMKASILKEQAYFISKGLIVTFTD